MPIMSIEMTFASHSVYFSRSHLVAMPNGNEKLLNWYTHKYFINDFLIFLYY